MMRPVRIRDGQAGSCARGFSLIELLLVVAIILIIAAIAIPNFMRSKIAANESSSVQNLRNITTANVVYSSTYDIGYASTLAALGPPSGSAQPSSANAQLIDEVLATGAKSGYTYSYTPGSPSSAGQIDSYTLTSSPISPGITGNRYFYTDDSGVIRQNNSAPATVSDVPIG